MPDDLKLITKNVFRSDRGEMRGVRRTDEGYLRLDGYIARPGIYVYKNADGSTRRELVPESTLHSDAALDSLKLKPLTNGHPDPDVYPDMVTMDNVQDLSVGTTGETVVLAEDGRPSFSLTVQQADAIADVESGKRELSPGYHCDLLWKGGEHEKFGKFDAIQVNRRYNHLALVDRARGGSSICLRMDGAAAITDEDHSDEESDEMDIIEALIEKGYSKQDAERLVADGATLIEKADKLDALPTDDEAAEARAADRAERQDLDAIASKVGLKAEDTVKMDNGDLKAAILKEAGIEVPKIDGIDEAVGTRFAWEAYKVTRKDAAEKSEDDEDLQVRLDAVEPLAFRFDNFDSTNTRK